MIMEPPGRSSRGARLQRSVTILTKANLSLAGTEQSRLQRFALAGQDRVGVVPGRLHAKAVARPGLAIEAVVEGDDVFAVFNPQVHGSCGRGRLAPIMRLTAGIGIQLLAIDREAKEQAIGKIEEQPPDRGID